MSASQLLFAISILSLICRERSARRQTSVVAVGVLRSTPLRGMRNAEHAGAPLPPSLGALSACGWCGAARARVRGGGGIGGARLVESLLEHLAKLDPAMSSIFCFCSAISASLRASSCARRSVRPTEPGARWRARAPSFGGASCGGRAAPAPSRAAFPQVVAGFACDECRAFIAHFLLYRTHPGTARPCWPLLARVLLEVTLHTARAQTRRTRHCAESVCDRPHTTP